MRLQHLRGRLLGVKEQVFGGVLEMEDIFVDTDHRQEAERQPRYQDWKGKRRRAMARHILIPIAVAAALFIVYGLIASHYYNVFLPGTVINGVDVSGMKVSRAEELLEEAGAKDYTLTVLFREDASETVRGEDIDLDVTFRSDITDVLDAQKPFSWLPRLLGRGHEELTVSGLRIFDTEKLADWLHTLPELQTENMQVPVDACMRFDENGYLEVEPEVPGTQLRESVLLNGVENAAAAGLAELHAEDIADAYVQPEITSSNAVLLEQIDRGNVFLGTSVTYTMHEGSEVTVDASVLHNWMSEEEDRPGWYYMNRTVLLENISAFVDGLADTYDAYYEYYDFLSTSYGYLSLPVNNGSYGYQINRTAETEALFQDVVDAVVETRVPVYSVATSLENGIGGTYIEVDTIAQKVYLYEDGENTFTSDCVTGLATDPERVTPTGIYTLYDKERDRTLQGTVEEETGLPSYMSAVSYWMPFSGGYGLHDASWRSVFGSTIYQTSGSHGCVNLPVLAAAAIYDAVEIGTPVIII